jgi:hypothetical protein
MTLTYGECKAVELLDIGESYEMGTYSTIFNVLRRSMGYRADSGR